MKLKPKFDKELSVRNAAYGALIGWLGAKHIGMTTEAGVACGIIIAPVLDAAIFRVKTLIAGK